MKLFFHSLIIFIFYTTLVGCSSQGVPNGVANGTADGVSNLKAPPNELTLLNVSYDPTREFYQDFNAAFADHWKKQTGQILHFDQSHGGSGKQARAVLEGLEADVVTLALAHDIDMLAAKGLVVKDWRSRLPHQSAPYTSTIVFLVRPGNPKGIHDWQDLVKNDVQLVAANPKTGGGARWNYLAAWGFSLHRSLGDLHRLKEPDAAGEVERAQLEAKKFVGEVYKRVVVLDSGARGATTSFLQRGLGDALICWENEAHLALDEMGKDQAELVVPSISILAEPPVAVVDRNVDQRSTRQAAEAYLEYLYSAQGQSIAARRYYRPVQPELVAPELLSKFPKLKLFTIEAVFGGWERAQADHFNDGAIFDQIYVPK
ncbi:MAG: sulfate ABC transporter substrate-binding protein [Pirellulaceae bacterium]|nr:sulfate ABC transporter substrate-binding protein [Pirellulaceae bacterium]